MSIVVFCRNIGPIDLTASLLLAHYRKANGVHEQIEWIVENSYDENLFTGLNQCAYRLKEGFDIKVLKRNEIAVLNPNNMQIRDHLLKVLKDSKHRKIRIQHGALCDAEGKKYRYFGIGYNNDLVLYDEKKNPCKFDYVGSLTTCGSFNLCILRDYGEICHLPWYCLDSDISPIMVCETISPPDGCGHLRFSGTNLNPGGYTLLDYISDADRIEQYKSLIDNVNTNIRSRIDQGTQCSKRVIQILSERSRQCIKVNGFEKELQKVEQSKSQNEETKIRNLVSIYQLGRVMISTVRGFETKVDSYRIPWISREEMILKLYECVNKSVEWNQDLSELIKNDHAFKEISDFSYQSAIIAFNSLYCQCFCENKANINNMIGRFSSTKELLIAFDYLLDKRGMKKSQSVKGSLFEYDD